MLGQYFVKVHAGDFAEGEGRLGTINGTVSLPVPGNGRKLLVSADGSAFTAIQAAAFPCKAAQ